MLLPMIRLVTSNLLLHLLILGGRVEVPRNSGDGAADPEL